MLTRRGSRASLCLGAIILLATLVRLSLGFVFFGFHTGDDVEILQAGFLRALGWSYQPWEIRNLLPSDLLAAPAIALASALGVSSTRVLVWSASLPFVALASLNIWLVYRLALEWLRSEPPALLAAGLYAFHWLPLGYGSMVYPRTASTTCVLLATLVLWKGRASLWKPILAGSLVAIAWAIRFSEVIFLLPLLAVVWMRGEGIRERALRCGALVAGFLAVSLLTIGVEDWLTWGRPFASLAAFVRYTLIERRSSSLVPVQPWYLYLWRLPKMASAHARALPLARAEGPGVSAARALRAVAAPHALDNPAEAAPLPSRLHPISHPPRRGRGLVPVDERQEAMGGGPRGSLAPARALRGEFSHQEVDGRRRGGAAARGLAVPAARDLPLAGVGVRRHTVSGARHRHPRAPVPPLRGGARRGARVLPLGRPLPGRPRRDARIAEQLKQQGYAPFGAYRWGRSRPVLVFRRRLAGDPIE